MGKKTSLIPIALIVALFIGVILYREKTICFESEIRNCKVNSWAFEKIAANQGYEDVKDILGVKNVERADVRRFDECAGADSVLIWGSNKYREADMAAIVAGFKDGKVHCKTFIKARKKE